MINKELDKVKEEKVKSKINKQNNYGSNYI